MSEAQDTKAKKKLIKENQEKWSVVASSEIFKCLEGRTFQTSKKLLNIVAKEIQKQAIGEFFGNFAKIDGAFDENTEYAEIREILSDITMALYKKELEGVTTEYILKFIKKLRSDINKEANENIIE